MSGGKGSSGSSGLGTQTTSTVNQSNLPEYARPYYESLMGRAQQVSNDPYEAYTGDRIAPLNADQNKALDIARTNTGAYSNDFSTASTKFGEAGGFTPTTATNTYNPTNMTSANWTDSGVSSSYMSPYTQGVTDIAKREAERDDSIMSNTRNSKAQSGGAFGGYRHGIIEAEADRNLGTRLSDIQTKGLDTAYNTGLGAFQKDNAANLESNRLNNTFGQQFSQLGQTATGSNNQYGIQSADARLKAGQAYAGLGQARQDAGIEDSQTLLNTGAIGQAQTQSGYDTAYADFLNQRDYNRTNLGWLSGILRGVPVSANSSTTGYTAPPSTVSQIAGLGLGAAGLSKLVK